MRVLNLYAGIGGNRKLWEGVEVTAVEYNQEIADIYKEYYPADTVIVGDAHEYLLNHYEEFDFIWASPPCPTHSRIVTSYSGLGREQSYPDMKLYQEIIFLKHFFKGKYCIENVIPYYEPLIKPTVELGRHFFWSNFNIHKINLAEKRKAIAQMTASDTNYGFNIIGKKLKHRKDQILRNLVNPEIGLYILEQARGIESVKYTQPVLF